MTRRGISQEGLKLIACLTMLLDHIGAVLVPGQGLRIIGRVAFPIYCFLLAEGMHYTRDPVGYGLRLGLGALLAEAPFDMALFGGLTWRHQSVMVTLLMAFFAIRMMEKAENPLAKLALALPFAIAAEAAHTDYGSLGVLMAVMFSVTRDRPDRLLCQGTLLALICWGIGGYSITVGPVRIPVEIFALLALIPISLYRGEKRSYSRALQWAFYLFYPVHLGVLAILS